MTYDKLEKRIKMHAFRRAYGNICKMPTSPKTLSKKRVCYQLKNYQDAGQVFWQSPNIRTLRQLGFRRQNVAERIMKMCPTWRLKEESK